MSHKVEQDDPEPALKRPGDNVPHILVAAEAMREHDGSRALPQQLDVVPDFDGRHIRFIVSSSRHGLQPRWFATITALSLQRPIVKLSPSTYMWDTWLLRPCQTKHFCLSDPPLRAGRTEYFLSDIDVVSHVMQLA